MKGYRKFLTVMLVIMIVSSIMSLIPPIWLQIWSRNNDSLTIEKILLIVILLLGTNAINSFLVLYRENYANKFNKENARAYLYDFLGMNYEKIIQEGPSNLLERIVTAVTNIYAYMTGGYIKVWSSAIIAIASIVLLLQINAVIPIVMILYVPLIYGGFKLINKELAKRSMELQAQTGVGFQEILSYIKEPDYFKQLPYTDPIMKKMNPSLDRIYDAMARINKFAQTSSITLSSMGTILQNVIMLLVVYLFMETNSSPYTLMITTIVVPLYFNAVDSITRANIDKKSYEASIEFGQMLKDNRERSGDDSLSEIEEVEINVDELIIRDSKIPFEAHAKLVKGDIGRVYGKSGSGKSTFAKAMVKFRQIEGVRINGIKLANLNNRDVRNRVEYVSQNIPIIKGTLRDNLLFGKEYLDIADSFFAEHHLLASIFEGKKLDDEILENGANLSGGEKQKIAIVRALLSEPELLILDEVCSNIDAKTSEEIYGMLNEERENRITIIISHDELPNGLTNIDINTK